MSKSKLNDSVMAKDEEPDFFTANPKGIIYEISELILKRNKELADVEFE